MNKKHMDIISSNEYYLAKSKLTGMPYIDNDRRCYLFTSIDIARPFLSSHESIEFEEKKKYTPIDICQLLHSCGAVTLFIWSNEPCEIPIDTKIIPNDFYNSDFMYLLLSLKQTQEKCYLKKMGTSKFYVPVYISERKESEYANIHYAYASLSGKSEKYYVVFSDLKEFEKWNSKMNNKWQLLEVKLNTLNNIRKKNPVIINPFGNKLILSHELLKKIPIKGEE